MWKRGLAGPFFTISEPVQRLDWSMLCPGPMIASENGKPTPNLRLAADEWPMARPTYTYVLPVRLALAKICLDCHEGFARSHGDMFDLDGPFGTRHVAQTCLPLIGRPPTFVSRRPLVF
jgi:hypothetical protein